MVRITEQLIRKRSEHNELIIGTLEELSLHQEDIERIEHIGNWCRELKILLLQSNLIPRLENLNRLKKLEYLNLAINNIERIENLEALEALHKLDLTLNFIGELTSIENLRDNYNLRELFLTGNPCTDYPGYREYVITILPQLHHLDGQEITRSERLRASREFPTLRERIVQLEALHKIERDEQRVRVGQSIAEQEESVREPADDDEERKTTEFWQQKSEHCPETRNQMAKFSRRGKDRAAANVAEKPNELKRNRKLFAECGRPYSLNEARLKFEFRDEPDRYELDLHVYKYLDTSLVEVDVQPNYVRVTVKGKVFQLALKQNVQTDRSSCQRSQTTGHLLLVMPKVNPERIVKAASNKRNDSFKPTDAQHSKPSDLKGTVDIRNICSGINTPKSAQINEDEVPDLI
uniref:Dynein axonemal assembly factor 11-like CS domain-containing protein n=1 Tax=Anopheles farauti TaxID=69004 RepID=A0A182QFW7_9DIPT